MPICLNLGAHADIKMSTSLVIATFYHKVLQSTLKPTMQSNPLEMYQMNKVRKIVYNKSEGAK